LAAGFVTGKLSVAGAPAANVPVTVMVTVPPEVVAVNVAPVLKPVEPVIVITGGTTKSV
jgi:hypothetical protein